MGHAINFSSSQQGLVGTQLHEIVHFPSVVAVVPLRVNLLGLFWVHSALLTSIVLSQGPRNTVRSHFFALCRPIKFSTICQVDVGRHLSKVDIQC